MMRIAIMMLGCLLSLTASAQTKTAPKRGIIMLHFGTSNDQSRAKTIDVINEKVKTALPKCEVVEAYSSKMVIDALNKRGIQKLNLTEALRTLYAKGCTNVTIQSTHLLPGVMQEQVEKEAKKVKQLFKKVRVQKPLLWSTDDCQQLADILVQHIAAKKNEQVVLVGHGTKGPANAMYTMIDYALKDKGYTNYHVATIEAFPGIESVKKLLKEKKAKRVILSPLLFNAGNHAVEDIQGDWREALEKEDYQVTVRSEGLGEMSEVQDWIVGKLKAKPEPK